MGANKATAVDFERGATDSVWAEVDELRQTKADLLAALHAIEEAGLGGYLTPELCADIVTEAIAAANRKAKP